MSEKTELLMESIMAADGEVSRYSAIAEQNRADFRTLNDFFAEKLKGDTKQNLAQKLGVQIHTINNWEKGGIPSLKQAVYIALALGLDLEDTNYFFRKYAGMGSLYPADRVHAQYIYMLVYRQELERSYPYLPGETVKSWAERVWQAMEAFTEPPKDAPTVVAESRVATELFLETLLSRNAEEIRSLPFRSAGEKACTYLREYVKGGPFEKNYGNRSHVDKETGESIRNRRILLDRYREEERDRYINLLDKLQKGIIVPRDELLQMAMLLRMTREQADGLLQSCGEERISARNLYEGALLLVWSFLSDLCPDWFGTVREESPVLTDAAFVWREDFLAREYAAELLTGEPFDLQVLFSCKVDEALEDLPVGLKDQRREVPGWYLTEEKRAFRLEKRRFSAILSECAEQMCIVWDLAEERGAGNLRWSLETAVEELLEDFGYEPLDDKVDQVLLKMLTSLEKRWLTAVKAGAELKLPSSSVEQYCLKMLEPLDSYYIETYAPKKRKGGAGLGKRTIE